MLRNQQNFDFFAKLDVLSLRRQAQDLTGPKEGNEKINQLLGQVEDLAKKQEEREC